MSIYSNINTKITFFTSFIFKQTKLQLIQKRYLYKVQHNINRQIFYIKLETAEKAVLLYKKNDNILDIQSVNVPIQYRRQGIGRLLAETAITYAVLNNYRLILTCRYMQSYYYNSIKNTDLEKHIIGPSNILSSSNNDR
ncbi:hypothetical protein PV328_006148 [Microctonus aethiopoides]|uniref:Protein NATD1 n=1 Tax=Microctonus aethiopoides TaxID=144406 RepID=A0AA39FNI1_9HYME|nr:hypothetical protein PV328_006148 [Microctonus aethiopoides]